MRYRNDTISITISFLIPVNVHRFSQLLSLYLWDPCCIPCCTCNLEACNKVYIWVSPPRWRPFIGNMSAHKVNQFIKKVINQICPNLHKSHLITWAFQWLKQTYDCTSAIAPICLQLWAIIGNLWSLSETTATMLKKFNPSMQNIIQPFNPFGYNDREHHP